MADDDVVAAKKKRTLLEKYDIPVNHLSFEYVNKCNDGKELERIVKILRSGEEGMYPDLEKCATKRLTEIMPSSRVLLVEEPVLTKNMLADEHWNQVNNDIANWSSEMKSKEQELNSAEDSFVTVDVPGIRSDKTKKLTNVDNEAKVKKIKSVLPRDYSEWDKYDPEKEILKMELEEEKHKEQLEKLQRQNEKETVKKLSAPRAKVVESAGNYSKTEKQFLATQEKDKGNEYFKSCEYKQAVEHYSASVAIDPSPVAYNNRAMAYIKLEQYEEALKDCNKVLALEPKNVKALHRRGIAYKHLNNLQKAVDDFLRVLQLEPSNRVASTLAQELQAKLNEKNKRFNYRMEIFEDNPKITELPEDFDIGEPCVEDTSAKVNTSWPPPPDGRVKCNEFGLPRVMCSCYDVPEWVRRPPPRCLTCKEIKERKKAEQQKSLQLDPKVAEASLEGCEDADRKSEDCESDEDCVCEHVEVAPHKPETVTSLSENEISLPNLRSEAAAIQENEETLVSENVSHSDITKSADESNGREEASVSKAASSKNSAQSAPKVKSGRKTEARRLLPTESVKPVKVQVASKYTTKTVVKGEEETTRGVQGIHGLSLEDGNTGKISTPYEFLNALQAAKGDSALLAPVLQRVDPSNLQFLIGNKLDERMLQPILECLRKCFIHKGPLVQKFLENLAALPRFGIVKMFLDSKTKQVIQELFDSLIKQNCELPSQLLEDYKL